MLTTPPTAELQYIADTARATWFLVYATWALAAVTLAIAGATLWVLWRQLQENKATTQLNLHVQLVNSFESEAMCAVRSRVAATLLRDQKPTPNDIERIFDCLESVAYYARRKMLDIDVVWNDYVYVVRYYWHLLNSYVIDQRTLRNDRALFEEIEWLYVMLQSEEARRRGLRAPLAPPTDNEIKAFLESEARFRDRFPPLRSPNSRQ
jgi:heme/copper-type cytochrome/quinol oxidase subunit 2